MAHKCHAIGMKIIAYDPYIAKADVPDYIQLKSLQEVMQESDVISLHCPLTDETRNMLDEKPCA